MGRPLSDRHRRVVQLRPDGGARGAEEFCRTTVANGVGHRFIVIAIDAQGRQDRRAFGQVTLADLSWAGACLQHSALHQAGEDE